MAGEGGADLQNVLARDFGQGRASQEPIEALNRAHSALPLGLGGILLRAFLDRLLPGVVLLA
jgi:hypothetical protein